MTHDPAQKLELRLVPADGAPPDYQVFDDIVRLIQQAHATAHPEAPRIGRGNGFRKPDGTDAEAAAQLVSQIQHDIEQASLSSQAAVETRAELARQPAAAAALAAEARRAAEELVSAVGRALHRGVAVRPPEPESRPRG